MPVQNMFIALVPKDNFIRHAVWGWEHWALPKVIQQEHAK